MEESKPKLAPRLTRRKIITNAGVLAVMAAAGTLFATSARLSRGNNLRNDTGDITQILKRQDQEVTQLNQIVDDRREQIDRLSKENREGIDPRINDQLQAAEQGVGLTPVKGPGLIVTLQDAPTSALTTVPDVKPNDLVVHQQDLEGYINALWAGGAEAMMLQDQRVISSSAFRCVGNTLLLQGRVYSPPFKVTAVGDVNRMRQALDRSSAVQNFRQWVKYVGLGEALETRKEIELPAYTGAVNLQYVKSK